MERQRTRQRQPDSEKLRGELMHFQVRSADMWGTGEVKTTHEGGVITVAGKLLGVQPGDTVELTGWWSTHERYGRQFKVSDCAVIVPQDASGVVGWLASKLPQISSRRAEELVQAHGVEGTWRVLDERDEVALCALDGITPARAAEIFDAYHLHKAGRDQIVRLKGFGLTDGQVAKVLKVWGADAEKELRADPYALIRHVDGFGWKRADEVATRMRVLRDLPARVAAGIAHTLQEAVYLGNCYVPGGALVSVSARMTLGLPEQPVRAELDEMIGRGELVRVGNRIYQPRLDQAEATLAKAFATRAAASAEKARAA